MKIGEVTFFLAFGRPLPPTLGSGSSFRRPLDQLPSVRQRPCATSMSSMGTQCPSSDRNRCDLSTKTDLSASNLYNREFSVNLNMYVGVYFDVANL